MTLHKFSPVINLVPRAILSWACDAWELVKIATALW